MTAVDRTRLISFFGVLVPLAAGFVAASLATDVSLVALAPAYMFTPLLAGLAVCLAFDVPLSAAGLRVGRPRWLLASILVALPAVVATLALSVAIPGVSLDTSVDPIPGLSLPPGPAGVVAALAVVFAAGATVNAAFAFGEEFGWRGYLLWELAPMGFWRASGAIGAVWGLWHAPVVLAGYNYPSFPVVGVAAMTLACVAFSPLYTYLVLRAESVLAAAFLHGVFNASAGLVSAWTVAEDAAVRELVASPVGVASVAVFGVVAAGIAVGGAPTLDRSGVGAESTAATHRAD